MAFHGLGYAQYEWCTFVQPLVSWTVLSLGKHIMGLLWGRRSVASTWCPMSNIYQISAKRGQNVSQLCSKILQN